MAAILTILLPIFGLILAGFACRRKGTFGPTAATELNRFVVWLALPALLFDIMAHSSLRDLWQPGFIGAFGGATALVFAVVLVARLRAGHALADSSIDAISASYSNTGYVGFPLGLLVFGASAQMPTTIASVIVVCVLFAAAVVLIECGLGSGRRGLAIAGKVGRSVATNPLVAAPAIGVAVAACHGSVPAFAETFLKLLGAAASPCALVSMGAFLAERRPARAALHTPFALSAAKLVALPLLTWWLAAGVFHVAPRLAQMAVLLNALPTGTGPFMLAEFYEREAGVTSRTILISTLGSMVTLSALLLAWR